MALIPDNGISALVLQNTSSICVEVIIDKLMAIVCSGASGKIIWNHSILLAEVEECALHGSLSFVKLHTSG